MAWPVAPRHVDQVLALESVMDEAEAIIARRGDRRHVRVIGWPGAALLHMLQYALDTPAVALRDGGAGDGQGETGERYRSDQATRLHVHNPAFSLRLVHETREAHYFLRFNPSLRR